MKKSLFRRLVCLTFAGASLSVFTISCEHAKFRSENGGSAMPWATPEGFENSGAGTPFGLMSGMQGR